MNETEKGQIDRIALAGTDNFASAQDAVWGRAPQANDVNDQLAKAVKSATEQEEPKYPPMYVLGTRALAALSQLAHTLRADPNSELIENETRNALVRGFIQASDVITYGLVRQAAIGRTAKN